MTSIILPGDPIPMQRHRYHTMGAKIGCYDPQKKIKGDIRLQILSQVQSDKKYPLPPSTGCMVYIYFFLPYPKGKNIKEKNAMEWGLQPILSKPDIDNLVKFYLDCGNGILYDDDKQILDLNVTKRYDRVPRTKIEIIPKYMPNICERSRSILEMVGPEDAKEIFNLLCKVLLNVSETNVEPDNTVHNQRLTQTAMLMSMISDKYASTMSMISKKYPKFYLEKNE